MLKYTYDTKDLLKLLRARKVILHKCHTDTNNDTNNDTNYSKILDLSHRCDKVSIKMMAILLNNMFPKDPDLEVYSKKSAKNEFDVDNNTVNM